MVRLLLVIIMLAVATPSTAFVSHIVQGAEGVGRIPCHDLRAVSWLFATGEITGAQAGQYLLDNYVAAWSAEDLIDNANLVTLLNNCGDFSTPDCAGGAFLSRIKQLNVVLNLESYCIAFEAPVTGAALTANNFRTRLGIPTQ
jgi:hypothetical protein